MKKSVIVEWIEMNVRKNEGLEIGGIRRGADPSAAPRQKYLDNQDDSQANGFDVFAHYDVGSSLTPARASLMALPTST
jgi:hypothetical protein